MFLSLEILEKYSYFSKKTLSNFLFILSENEYTIEVDMQVQDERGSFRESLAKIKSEEQF